MNAQHNIRVHSPGLINRNNLFFVKDGRLIDSDSLTLDEIGVHEAEVFSTAAERQHWLSSR